MKISEVMGQWLKIMLVGCSGRSLTACLDSQATGPGGLRPAYDRILLAGDIQVAETHLRDVGYDPGPVDGVFTAETQAALRAYQACYRLTVWVEAPATGARQTWLPMAGEGRNLAGAARLREGASDRRPRGLEGVRT